MPEIWQARPKLENKMPWHIVKRGDGDDEQFCVVKESDGKTVKCHPTREKAKSHLAALYVNEPSAAKKSMGYGLLKSLITERRDELKACGANKPGGGGFSAGNTCARGGKGGEIKKGDRVALTEHPFMNPETSKLAKAASGVVTGVDPAGNVTVKWDKAHSKLAKTWRADLLEKAK